MSVNGNRKCSFPLRNHFVLLSTFEKKKLKKEMIRQGPIGPLGAPQLAIQFYGIVLHKNNVGLGEREEAVAQEVLLKDSFFGILAKDSLFGPV